MDTPLYPPLQGGIDPIDIIVPISILSILKKCHKRIVRGIFANSVALGSPLQSNDQRETIKMVEARGYRLLPVTQLKL
jgi:hypothetical protein